MNIILKREPEFGILELSTSSIKDLYGATLVNPDGFPTAQPPVCTKLTIATCTALLDPVVRVRGPPLSP